LGALHNKEVKLLEANYFVGAERPMLTLDQLISEATALPDAAKAILIDKIVGSMGQSDPNILIEAVQKAQGRIAEIDGGAVQTIRGDIALAKIRQLIEKTPSVVGGDACIRGTRIPVWELVEYRQLGASTSKILEAYPQLTEQDLQAAWDYHRSFPEEIAGAIAANEAA
jgi:uncharacterized protein (DUF433 family)